MQLDPPSTPRLVDLRGTVCQPWLRTDLPFNASPDPPLFNSENLTAALACLSSLTEKPRALFSHHEPFVLYVNSLNHSVDPQPLPELDNRVWDVFADEARLEQERQRRKARMDLQERARHIRLLHLGHTWGLGKGNFTDDEDEDEDEDDEDEDDEVDEDADNQEQGDEGETVELDKYGGGEEVEEYYGEFEDDEEYYGDFEDDEELYGEYGDDEEMEETEEDREFHSCAHPAHLSKRAVWYTSDDDDSDDDDSDSSFHIPGWEENYSDDEWWQGCYCEWMHCPRRERYRDREEARAEARERYRERKEARERLRSLMDKPKGSDAAALHRHRHDTR